MKFLVLMTIAVSSIAVFDIASQGNRPTTPAASKKSPKTSTAPEYVLIEADVSAKNRPEFERMIRNDFLPAIRADRRVLAVFSYAASGQTLFSTGKGFAETEIRFIIVLKIEHGVKINYSTLIDVLTKKGKSEADVVKEIRQLGSLVIRARANKGEFNRGISVVRTPFSP